MFKFVVLFSVLALAAAKPSVLAYNVPLGYSVPFTYNAVPTAVSSFNQYRSIVGGSVLPTVFRSGYPIGYPAVSSTPNSPAVVFDAVHGVPLDTPEVVAARAAHYQAKALAGVHHLAKRSVVPVNYNSVVPSVYPVAPVSPFVRSYVSPYSFSSPYASTYTAPLSNYGYPLVPKVLSGYSW